VIFNQFHKVSSEQCTWGSVVDRKYCNVVFPMPKVTDNLMFNCVEGRRDADLSKKTSAAISPQ
jgi:hypothetical protein